MCLDNKSCFELFFAIRILVDREHDLNRGIVAPVGMYFAFTTTYVPLANSPCISSQKDS